MSHDTLLHRETLSIVSTGNFENVAFVFITKTVAFDFLAHPLFEEGTTRKQVKVRSNAPYWIDGSHLHLSVAINFDCLLAATLGICDIELKQGKERG